MQGGIADPDEFAGAFGGLDLGDYYDKLANEPDVSERSFWDDPDVLRDEHGNMLDPNTVMDNLNTYIEENENIKPMGLFEDDAGVHLLKENEAGQIVVDEKAPNVTAADVAQYQEAVEAGAEVRGIDFSDIVKAKAPRSGIKGRTNPKAGWRVDDTSGKWFKPKQKFSTGTDVDEGGFEGADMSAGEYEAKYGDIDETADTMMGALGTKRSLAQVDAEIRAALQENNMNREATFRSLNNISENTGTDAWQQRLGGGQESYQPYWDRIDTQITAMGGTVDVQPNG